MRHRLTTLAAVAALTMTILPTSVSASHDGEPAVTVLATGLNNPRGVFADGKTVYVAEAGLGGAGPCFPGPEGETCLGETASITRVDKHGQERIIEGLPSGASPGGFAAGGAEDVFVKGNTLYFVIGLGADPALRTTVGGFAENFGFVFTADLKGKHAFEPHPAFDAAGFEGSDNPDEGEVDSNPVSLWVHGNETVVADAGGNYLLHVDKKGNPSAAAVFPDVPTAVPFPPFEFPMQAVPTAVVRGPDKAWYVGQLTGFPFPVGGASVFRVADGEVTEYASGFTNIMDIAFDDKGTLYVLEIAHESLLSFEEGPGAGGLWAVYPNGSRDLLLTDPLVAPGGIDVGKHGEIYVSNCGVCPGGGELLRIDIEKKRKEVRFATFNASLNRFSAGGLISDLSTPDNAQAQAVAEIIQRTDPDVLLINEFDYDADGEAARLFQENYLGVSQNGATPIHFPYVFQAPSNTGVPSGKDLNNDGAVGGPNDAFGFGFFEGQFGMLVLSKFPIDHEKIRTFQEFLWRDMPGALLPDDPGTPEAGDWYSADELGVFRLSSKSHWDVPILIGKKTVHFLVSHPTPPVFDDPPFFPEGVDFNGRRNHDEIRFWADYVSGKKKQSAYIYDDDGVFGGLGGGDLFVIAGDQNSDPFDGDSIPGSAQLLLDHKKINTKVTPSSPGGPEQSALQGGANETHLGDPLFDTADFSDGAAGNLRVDYVLPSKHLKIIGAGVFWPESDDPLFSLVGTFPFPSSDHRLVWIDVEKGGFDKASK